MFFNWFKKSRPSIRKPVRRNHCVPRLELLEDRRVPALFTVNTLADTINAGDGVTSLREAVLGSNVLAGPDEIRLQAGGGTITLTSGELSITDSVTIIGDFNGTTISGNNDSRIFRVDDGSAGHIEVEMVRLTLTSGHSIASGGAIRNIEDLTLTNCTLSDNSAGVDGGGLFNGGVGTVTLTNCTLSNNSADEGGGFCNRGTATLTNCTLSGNSVVDGAGGGFFNDGTATLNNCTVADNSADPELLDATSFGGGVRNDGTLTMDGCTLSDNVADHDGALSNTGSATLTNCTIADNSANGGEFTQGNFPFADTVEHSFGRAGGVHNYGFGTLVMDGCTLSGNTAEDRGGAVLNGGSADLTNCTISGNSADFGGGIVNEASATLTDCTLSDNSAVIDGGGVFNNGTATLTNCTLSGNSAGAAGGGLFNDEFHTVTLTNCTLSGNAAAVGGGIVNDGSATMTDCTLSSNSATNFSGGGLVNVGTATLTNCILSDNTADERGGGLANVGTATLTNCTLSGNSAVFGGGVFNFSNGTATLTDCTLSGNAAGDEGGGLYNRGTATLTDCTLSGNSAVNDGGGVFNLSNSTATLTGSTLSGNSALYGGGLFNSGTATLAGCTLSDNAAGTGGGVYNDLGGTASLTGCSLSGNLANFGVGAGVFNDGTVTMTGCALTDNAADWGGGGFFNDDNGTATLIDCTLSNNSVADDCGGGLANFRGTVELTNCILSDNTASEDGGGLFNFAGILTLTGCTLSDNTAEEGGGGLCNRDGAVTLTDCTLSSNSAGGGGGLLNVTINDGIDSIATATLTNCTLSNNAATNSGAGALANTGTVTLTDCTLSGNSASQDGGGVINYGTATLTGCILSDNSAGGDGGGILNYEDSFFHGTLTLTDCTLSGNSASQDGGGLYNDATATLTGCTLSGNSADFGGGLFNVGTATLTHCSLSNNSTSFGGGALFNIGTATLTNCTLASNSALGGGGLFNADFGMATLTNCTLADNEALNGGGIVNLNGGTATLNHTIVANSIGADEIANDGTLTGSHNLVEDGSDGLADTIVADPLLGPFADNGGPTFTHALLPGSLAINAGDDALVPSGVSTDQRGANRFIGTVDIGAFEEQAAANNAPTNIALSQKSVQENRPVGSLVGAFSTTDPDGGETHTYTLVSGAGDTGNAEFQIVENQLRTNASFNFETQSSYSVRVRTTDAGGLPFEKVFTINVVNVNEAPTSIALSTSSIAENQPVGTAIARFSTTDPDVGNSHTYALVSGAGDADNALFEIVGDRLRANASFNFEARSSYTIRVRSTDNGNLFNGGPMSVERVLTVTVTNINEAPANLVVSNVRVAEDQPIGTVVGTLITRDPDVGDPHTYALVSGVGSDDNAAFQIVDNRLVTNAVFDFETQSSYTIRVRTTDAGGLRYEKVFTITVFSNNATPTIVVPGAQTAFEDVDKAITGITVSDPDGGNLSVTLNVAHGTLTLDTIDGLNITGNSTGSVTLFGSIADLNAALATLVYRGTLNFSGADSLNVSVSDGNFSAIGSVAINVKSAAQQAIDLQAQVTALRNAGVFSNGQTNSLLVKLNLNGSPGEIGKVQSFIDKVDDLLQQGVLTQAQADALLGPANILLLSVTRR